MPVAVEEQHDVAALQPGLRTIKVGLVGLGNVGQAIARLAPEAARLKDAGYRVRVVGALVRDVEKPRRCVKPRLTSNASAFLRGNYDVVVEACGAVEPARSIVSRLLGRGIPVVSANKALVAAHGQELIALAARRGTAFRYEASALAGVPFLGAFAARPLVSDVTQLTAIVNGTSNFILSKLEADGGTQADALARAQSLGFSEPDASRDLDGLDAADKLALLSSLFGWGLLPAFRLDVQGIRDITAQDFVVARSLNCTIKPIVYASYGSAGVSAFVGPALISSTHPLATLRGPLCGIQLSGRFVSDLVFSGPGAGPDVTAATILDDVVEAVATRVLAPTRTALAIPRLAAPAAPPSTAWFVRATFPGIVPDASTTSRLFAVHSLSPLHVTEALDRTRWIQLAATTRGALNAALDRIATTHRIQTFAIRSL